MPLGTNGTLLLVDLILYSYEAECIQDLVKAGINGLAEQFNFIYRYTDNVLSLNISKLSRYLEFIYPREIKTKETFGTITSSSYLDLYLYSDNWKLITLVNDKRNDFNFRTANFSFLSSNIPFV